MATTEQVGSSVEQIPFVALEALGRIFHEGEKKYGIGNWKDNPTPEYRVERLRHAIRHLFLFAEDDVTEAHLAKVLWFCVTELYCESKYGPLRDSNIRERYPNAKHKIHCAACGLDTTSSTHCSDPKPGCHHQDGTGTTPPEQKTEAYKNAQREHEHLLLQQTVLDSLTRVFPNYKEAEEFMKDKIASLKAEIKELKRSIIQVQF